MTDKQFAIVTARFEGCRDGEFKTTEFVEGDALEGDIAAAAVSIGKAEPCTAEEFAAATAAKALQADESGEPDLAALLAKNGELRASLDDAFAARAEAEAERDAARHHVEELQASVAELSEKLKAAEDAAAAKAQA